MSIDKSLISKSKLVRQRNVLTRPERIKYLMDEGLWDEKKSVYGLPKVKIVKIIFIAILLYLLSSLFFDTPFYEQLVAKFLLLFSFPFILYFFNFYEQIELETIKRLFKKYLFFKKV